MTYTEASRKLEEMGLILTNVPWTFNFTHPRGDFTISLKVCNKEWNIYEKSLERVRELIREQIDP